MLTVLSASIICIQIYLYSNTGIQIYKIYHLPCSPQTCPEPEKNQKEMQILEQQLECLHPNQRPTHQPEGQQWGRMFSLSKWWGLLPPSLGFKGTPAYWWILCPGWIMTKLQKAAQRSQAFGFQASHFKRLYQTLVRKRAQKLLAERAMKTYKMKVNAAADFGNEI